MEWLMGKARGVSRGLISGSMSSPNSATAIISATTTSTPSDVHSSPSPPPPSPPPYLKPSFLRQQLSLAAAGNTPVDFPFLVEPEHPLEEDEWIAVHTIGLVENLCSIFDPLYEVCLCRGGGSSSPSKATDDVEFTDSFVQTKKPVRQVISLILSECNDAIQSARIFPVRQGQAFSPSDLREEAARICRKLLLCLVHIYTAHVNHLEQLDLVAHMNTIAKHFFAFTSRFNLIEEEDNRALAALQGFHRRLLETPAPNVIVSTNPMTPTSVATVTTDASVASSYSMPSATASVTPAPSILPVVISASVQEQTAS
ncbi:MOB kinase activator-like 2 [Echinococcus granulosus]|uniref:Mob1 phocein n=2 Tax=Echinococcus granulosus TaxID=6210 RepID=A0A068WZ30_ECHGR|nr:MOB kinase activator-like 2 [Echinococcus granulosus]CDS22912.1 Mob1 phocein [Echinococcus granulosus]